MLSVPFASSYDVAFCFAFLVWLIVGCLTLFVEGMRLVSRSKRGFLQDRLSPITGLIAIVYATDIIFSRVEIVDIVFGCQVAMVLYFLIGIVQGLYNRRKDHEG